MKRKAWAGVALGALVLAVAGYALWPASKAPAARNDAAGAAGGPSAAAAGPRGGGGPVSVTTVVAQRRDVDVLLQATGTVTPLNSVEIRPQIASVITRVHIREGQFVKAGDLLFTLDARNDQVNVAKADAQLARDAASLADAQRQLARSRELLAQNFVSQGAVDTNQTQVDAQLAVVAASRAAIDAARVGLSYTRIVAPAAGRAGAINVFAGSTVQPGGTALVTITQLDPIAVAFNLPQRHLDDALGALRSGGAKVAALLPEGRGTLAGRLDFVDNLVDPGSGTVRVKARFDNRSQTLWPGAFVGIELAARTLKGAVVVPQAAVIQSPRGTIVYGIDAASKAVARPVEVVYAAGIDAVVTGIDAGERVVLDGRQNLRPGAAVVEPAASGAGKGRRPPAPAAGASDAVPAASGPMPAAAGLSSGTPAAAGTAVARAPEAAR